MVYASKCHLQYGLYPQVQDVSAYKKSNYGH